VARKQDSERRDPLAETFYKHLMRHAVETIFRQIASRFPKRLRAVTAKRF